MRRPNSAEDGFTCIDSTAILSDLCWPDAVMAARGECFDLRPNEC
jgi:hypothetical protein